MDIQRFEIENITKSGFACVRDILTDRLLVTSDSCDLLNEQYQKILDLQSQLAEKDKEIEEILSSKKHFKTCAENMSDVLKTINSVLPKPQENGLNYKKVADDVVALIKEKDKEIERLKVFEKAYYFNQLQASQEDIQQFQQLANQSAVNINYIAIQELEKVKEFALDKVSKFTNSKEYQANQNWRGLRPVNHYELQDFIDNQIKELKGEKDVED